MEFETRCIRIKLKKDTLPKVREWQSFILKNKEEAIATLAAEGVYLESVFLETVGETNYLIYVMISKDFDKAKSVASQSRSPVDVFHSRFKEECWEDGERLEPLLQLYSSFDKVE